MAKKLTGRALAKFEAERDVWQEVLDGVREIKAGKGKRKKVEAKSRIVRVRLKSGLSQAQFAIALGVSKRTLEQWEQGRREPSGVNQKKSLTCPNNNALSLTRHLRHRVSLRVVGRQESLYDHVSHDALSPALCLLRVHRCVHDQDGRGGVGWAVDHGTAGVVANDHQHPYVLHHSTRNLVPAQR